LTLRFADDVDALNPRGERGYDHLRLEPSATRVCLAVRSKKREYSCRSAVIRGIPAESNDCVTNSADRKATAKRDIGRGERADCPVRIAVCRLAADIV